MEFLGNLPHDTVLQYLKTEPVDLMLNTSSSEGVPVSIMRAYSHGIPVVATDVGGNSEIVLKEHLIPSNPNSEDIAKIINEWTDDPQIREKVSIIQSKTSTQQKMLKKSFQLLMKL